jgi:organic hydroperoxide reductase OsmC/OhrA
VVTVADAEKCEHAQSLHRDAEKLCFIARSVNFPVQHQPVAVVDSGPLKPG